MKKGPAEAGPGALIFFLSRWLVVALFRFVGFRGRRAIALVARAGLRAAAAQWAALTGGLALRRSLAALVVLLSGWLAALALVRLFLSRLVRLSGRALS